PLARRDHPMAVAVRRLAQGAESNPGRPAVYRQARAHRADASHEYDGPLAHPIWADIDHRNSAGTPLAVTRPASPAVSASGPSRTGGRHAPASIASDGAGQRFFFFHQPL